VKLNTLLEVAGESVQAANQAAVLLEKLSQFKFDGQAAPIMSALTETLTRASRYSTELQRATLATRMQPVGRLFQKFPRLVRELARDLGKDVDLVIPVRKPKSIVSLLTVCTTRWFTCCAMRLITVSNLQKTALKQ
jgi:two-component system chemotaxis sensor kinase CheA